MDDRPPRPRQVGGVLSTPRREAECETFRPLKGCSTFERVEGPFSRLPGPFSVVGKEGRLQNRSVFREDEPGAPLKATMVVFSEHAYGRT